uniref:Uncharacterized protein n=1 Tax=Esox lucius TaxID=8010 RepID=A0A3P8YAN8_ESOLU
MVSSIECLFKPTRRENYVDVFYSFKNRLLDGAEVHVKGHDRSTRQIVYRSKRSQQVHSVIPEAEPIAEDQYLDIQHIQERAGVISKETITSCDDPLRVLHSNSPGSPIKKAVEKTDAE